MINFIDAGVTGLEMDLKIFSADSSPLHMRVGLEGPGQTRFVSIEAFELPADDQWHSVTFGLSGDLGRRRLEWGAGRVTRQSTARKWDV